MASSNIKLFDENKGNMSSDTEYSSDAQRLNGVQTGIASSKLQNKTLYQTSLVAYAIAQLMLANNLNANDSDAVSTFVSNLSSAILQPNDVATESEATAGTSTNKIINRSTLASVICGSCLSISDIFISEKLGNPYPYMLSLPCSPKSLQKFLIVLYTSNIV